MPHTGHSPSRSEGLNRVGKPMFGSGITRLNREPTNSLETGCRDGSQRWTTELTICECQPKREPRGESQ